MINTYPEKKVAELARVAESHGFEGTDKSAVISLAEYHMLTFRSGMKSHVLAYDPGNGAQKPGFRFLTVGSSTLYEWATERAPLSALDAEDPDSYLDNTPLLHQIQDYIRHSSAVAMLHGSTYTPSEAIKRIRRDFPDDLDR